MSKSARVKSLPIGKPLRRPDRLPWPRTAPDDPSVQLGVDVIAKEKDIVKIVHKFFRVHGVTMDELLQEVFLAIVHKNGTRSAHDQRKSSFGHYVYMVANNVCVNLVHKRNRYDRERDCIDAPAGRDDGRSLLEVYESEASVDDAEETSRTDDMDHFETELRDHDLWDVARYVRALRTGANRDVIMDALSWGDRQMTNVTLRAFQQRARLFAEGKISEARVA